MARFFFVPQWVVANTFPRINAEKVDDYVKNMAKNATFGIVFFYTFALIFAKSQPKIATRFFYDYQTGFRQHAFRHGRHSTRQGGRLQIVHPLPVVLQTSFRQLSVGKSVFQCGLASVSCENCGRVNIGNQTN